jgi:hypothetical protein
VLELNLDLLIVFCVAVPPNRTSQQATGRFRGLLQRPGESIKPSLPMAHYILLSLHRKPSRCLISFFLNRRTSIMATAPSPNPPMNLPAPLQIFTLFPLLPLELQTAIWIHTLPPPRLYELSREVIDTSYLAHMSKRIDYYRQQEQGTYVNFYFTTFYYPPVILHVSKRTRQLVLPLFERYFSLDMLEGEGKNDFGVWYEALIRFWEEW